MTVCRMWLGAGVGGREGHVGQPAQTVTLVEASPKGMATVAVVEEPGEGGEPPQQYPGPPQAGGCCETFTIR